MTTAHATTSWWRPEARAAFEPAPDGRLAFRALSAFTAILLLSPQQWFPVLGSMRIAFIAAGVAILAHLLDRAVRRHALDPVHREVHIAGALVAWSVLTIPLSYWPGGSVTELTDHFLKAIAFFWLIGAVVTTRARLRTFVWLLVACSVPLSITALTNYQEDVFLTTPRMAVQRIAGYMGSGLAANPNDLALLLNILIPFAGVLIVTSKGAGAKLVAFAALGLATAAVIVTFSRAGFLALIATWAMTVVALVRRQPFFALAGLIVLLGLGPMLLPSGYLDRVATITDISSDPTGSAQGRWADFLVSAELIARNPLTGAGIGQNILALNELRGPSWRYVHNVYLQYGVDLGIPGLVLFLWLFVAVFRAAGRARRDVGPASAGWGRFEVGAMADGVQIALVAFAVAAFFSPVAYQFYFYCLAGLALAVRNAARAEMSQA